jgi:hypothetical protein
VQALQEIASPDTAATEDRLRRQIDHINHTATWHVRAGEWLQWLRTRRVSGPSLSGWERSPHAAG